MGMLWDGMAMKHWAQLILISKGNIYELKNQAFFSWNKLRFVGGGGVIWQTIHVVETHGTVIYMDFTII